jgi:hypothetical protein
MSKKAMELALEALRNSVFDEHTADETFEAMKALEEALAKQEQGEPVAWQWLTTAHFRKKLPKDAEKGAWNPLYTTPQKRTWVGLTDEEIEDLMDVVDHYNFPEDLIVYTQAKLKEKNT